jgi:hypothetical protein
MTGVLGFLAFLLLAWAAVRISDSFWRKTMRTVRPGTHRRGQQLAHEATVVSAPVSPQRLLAEIVAAVNARPDPPAVVAEVYLAQRTPTMAQFVMGTRHATGFVFAVEVRGDESTSQGTASCRSWTKSDGLVQRIDRLELLHVRVGAAAMHLGGSVQSAPTRATADQSDGGADHGA